MRLVLVRFGAAARRDREQLHVDRRRARGFGRNRSGVREALLADERLACAEANTSGGVLDRAIRHHRFFSG
jgi:hypothetical protein